MTTISEIFSLDINSKLDMHTMGLIMSKGHSRVPIYSGTPHNIIGLILVSFKLPVKNLITCHHEDEVSIRNVTIRKIPRICRNFVSKSKYYVILPCTCMWAGGSM
ncbi:DUF21 domain-containing protein At4g33700-like [Asparagus officinalis]|uniref:DUF21 domain-containing protein At4g33700-like n=1 Tax=Asparagus officinalis TaxID=4686 RepID=UPI00098E697C|nr:DUF21 domain-containing protein At4g33700-like [Asparagus officinalis]XP_020261585.1 DUF21 domain-containing protein At4g33700-like [Asparagus officinalis]XP_020261586.1 DUF21 domain-containing protein At4g33700-like [Asparagus officinalis]XP_020261587.1 DUF21 domain-containing protein At4g33700-like [Asparagus officinalis]XP_020261588.1 DUF21 domain-containing protein At4g33700-like [Asparagus officinalis]XP_020261589.1 DUF21 domain-containing protein At4g33700-like [Asparagus officinalis]